MIKKFAIILEELKHDFNDARLENIDDNDGCQVNFGLEIRASRDKSLFDFEDYEPDDIRKDHISKWFS